MWLSFVFNDNSVALTDTTREKVVYLQQTIAYFFPMIPLRTELILLQLILEVSSLGLGAPPHGHDPITEDESNIKPITTFISLYPATGES